MLTMTACGACGRRVRRPKRCGKRAPRCRSPSQSCDRVFHAAGRIHRPSATIRPTRMPQERRSRRRPTCAPPRRSPWTGHGVAFADVFGAAFVRRIEGPFSSMRCVSWSNRSQIASAAAPFEPPTKPHAAPSLRSDSPRDRAHRLEPESDRALGAHPPRPPGRHRARGGGVAPAGRGRCWLSSSRAGPARPRPRPTTCCARPTARARSGTTWRCCAAIRTTWPRWPTRWSSTTNTPRT